MALDAISATSTGGFQGGQLAMVTAVVFDMDGLMFDTERLARDAWQRAMADHGYVLDDELFLRGVGRTVEGTCAAYVEALGPDLPIVAIEAAKARYLRELLGPGPPLKPGLLGLLDALSESRLPTAVASSTAHLEVDRRLVQVGIRQHFAAIAGGDEVARGKPSPDLFLLAARRLDVEPAGCVVLEDSAPGIAAAAAAGMKPIMVPDLIEASPEVRERAVAVVASLDDALEVILGY